jgi:hypothetical protein
MVVSVRLETAEMHEIAGFRFDFRFCHFILNRFIFRKHFEVNRDTLAPPQKKIGSLPFGTLSSL